MKRIITTMTVLALLTQAGMATRIKDIASFDGVRENQLVGYGLVVGLNGTGDSDQTTFPIQSLVNMLERMGVSVNPADVKVKNVAAVMVTATLPPFAKQGTRVDVLASSLGDAKSLAGGTLLMTTLKGADGQVYAVAQGPVLTNSFSYGGQAASAQKNHPTAGRVASGALVEREIPMTLAADGTLRLNLHEPDFSTAAQTAATINTCFGQPVAEATDPSAVRLVMPDAYRGRTVEFLAAVEKLEVVADQPARVVLNERTGTIVIGENVRISTVAVSHGNLTLAIREAPQVSQPQALSDTGETKVVPRTSLKVTEEGGKGLAVVKEGIHLSDLVTALNALGVTPRDLIAILQAIRAAGAMQAELVII
ncbi:MAG TPA: flagellar basal body P-ring protein FlgI [Geobacterales bacterium]|nr:flagellar basal body P-ring protein FlgI [Geobacterales bacterium]